MSLLKRVEEIIRKTGVTRFHTVRKLGRFLTGICLPSEVEIRVGDNSRMIVDPRKDSYFYYGYESVEPGVTDVMDQNLTEGSVFIDVGAYIGFYSIRAREFVGSKGRVIAFEPHPENYKELVRNIKINSYENIFAENLALSDKREMLRLFLASDLATPTIVELKGSYVEVEAISLDEYVESRSLEPDLIKIDAEGSEYKIIRGMSLMLEKSHPKIIVEVHVAYLEKLGIPVEELFKLLGRKGYTIEEIDDGGVRPIHGEVRVTKTNYGNWRNPILYCW